MVLHLGSLEYTHYMLNIQFYGLKEFHKRYFIREVVFYVSILCLLVVVTKSGSKDQKDFIFLFYLLTIAQLYLMSYLQVSVFRSFVYARLFLLHTRVFTNIATKNSIQQIGVPRNWPRSTKIGCLIWPSVMTYVLKFVVYFQFKTYNPAFTQMETWFRFIFLLTTFTVAVSIALATYCAK